MDKTFVGYVTKYVVTEGITAHRMRDVGDGLASVQTKDGRERGWYLHRGEWHRDYADAVKDAQARLQRKIALVKRQAARLEATTFPETPPDVAR